MRFSHLDITPTFPLFLCLGFYFLYFTSHLTGNFIISSFFFVAQQYQVHKHITTNRDEIRKTIKFVSFRLWDKKGLLSIMKIIYELFSRFIAKLQSGIPFKTKSILLLISLFGKLIKLSDQSIFSTQGVVLLLPAFEESRR